MMACRHSGAVGADRDRPARAADADHVAADRTAADRNRARDDGAARSVRRVRRRERV